MLRQIQNPDLYHGHHKKRNFFEGWYFKLVDPTNEYAFALIPGIFMGGHPDSSHSFIQVLDGKNALNSYEKYEAAAFHAASDRFEIAIENNLFSLGGTVLNIESPTVSLHGKLSFTRVSKWPDSPLNPGSMGFYNYLTFMQCYSQVCALDMGLTGNLTLNGKNISFDGGKGYIEKNWGKAFPYSWIWVQSNHFKTKNASLSCSIGHIPFLGGSFRGLLVGLLVENQFYAFTTMNRSKAHIRQEGSDARILLENSKNKLHINIKTDRDKFTLLKGPRGNQMIPLVQENLFGTIEITLTDCKSDAIIFSDTGVCAGVEYGGDQMLILDGQERSKSKNIPD